MLSAVGSYPSAAALDVDSVVPHADSAAALLPMNLFCLGP
jgi:hypothetical protein